MLELTQGHIDRAFRIARWYGRKARRAELSDLESAALEGLAKAAHDWDPQWGRRSRRAAKRSFWHFAFIRILGEMRDELRRFDHLTRDQRARVVSDPSGELLLDESLSWIDPQQPISLHVDVTTSGERESSLLIELVEAERNPIHEFELRDALDRASARLTERARFLLVMRDLEGFPNGELAQVLRVSEGRVSQLRRDALERMQQHIGDSLLDAA